MSPLHSPRFSHPYEMAAITDIGRLRRSNQDETLLLPEDGFLAVSDGMGGLPCGGDTSRYIVSALPSVAEACNAAYDAGAAPDPGALLASYIQVLSDGLYQEENKGMGRSRYGATLCAAWLTGDQAIVVSLGDSRAYLLPADGPLTLLTEDQNKAWAYVRDGRLSRADALNHPGSSLLTAFFGMREPADVQVISAPLAPGDMLLLCSDGLYSMVPEGELPFLLHAEDSLEKICEDLVREANSRGGRDNIGLALLRVLP